MKSFLSVSDASKPEIDRVLARAKTIKAAIKGGRSLSTLRGKIVGLLFEKPSTRTRTSFEVAARRLGGESIYLSANELQLSRGEPIKDTARILGGYLDGIVARVYAHDTVAQLAKYSGVPVVNALSDLEHPTQIISDLFTIEEAKRRLKGLVLAYVGDGNNVCNSLLLGAAIEGMRFRVACPEGYEPNQAILKQAEEICRSTGGETKILRKPSEAAGGADVLYTDVWVSMGDESSKQKRMQDFNGYQINSDLLKVAKKDASVMHCLPAHRGLEITDEVIEGKQSVVWQQGENKLYGAAALLEWLLRRK
ncbi:ornithine carbamoyltransferase [Candidatus Bathyarchaeota archaeon]|nr:MAG: ornithine carbamoyltransferase [Candidatus Bathyarchaeota archaeon]